MEYSLYKENNVDKNMQNFSCIKNESIEDKFKNYENLHLSKGRGFAVYNTTKLVLVKANSEYKNQLMKQYGCEEIQIGSSFYEISNNNLSYSRLPLLKEVIKTGNLVNIDLFKCETVIHKNMFLEITFIPIYENNKIKYIIESSYDVTERENHKAKINVLEKQKEFFFFACHELKMPLTVTLAAIQMLKCMCQNDGLIKYINKIKQASLQQLRLVNNILEVLKSDRGFRETQKSNLDIVKITTAMIDSVSVYANKKGVKLNLNSSIDELILGIDIDKYERILMNLLSNAIKFTPKYKEISVVIDKIGEYISIEVKDEGIGIAKDKLDVIFELFGQVNNSSIRENEGTGIGLYLVTQLIEQLNGEIQVTSKIGKGSSFIIFLPTEKIKEEVTNFSSYNLKDDKLIESTNIEFSSIYFDVH